jgi:hypothetical protein
MALGHFVKAITSKDSKLHININAVAKAFYWSRLIETGIVKNGSEIARKEGVEASTVNELLRLTLLDPKIIESILNGTQPPDLNIQWFTRNPLPVEWPKQTLIHSLNQTKTRH